jgi:hypothetical protein
MRWARRRRGVSKLIIPVAVIVVIAVAGAYFALSRSSTTSSGVVSSAPPPTSVVSTEVNQLVQNLDSRNVDGLVALYSPNSVLVWSGNVGGLAGMYTGDQNIRLIYAATVGKSFTLDANLSNYKQTVISPSIVNATWEMKLLANSTAAGVVRATIDVTEQWSGVSGAWQISKENWAYTLYDSSLIDAGIPSSTTFPQWGYELKGGNPNLVSEKSFEWHAGPYIAASVYAFLFGVLALTVLRLRTLDRKGGPTGRP